MKIHRWKSNCYQEGKICAESNPQSSTHPVNQRQRQFGKGSIPSDDGGISTSKQETETGKLINNVDETRETGLDNSGTVGNTPQRSEEGEQLALERIYRTIEARLTAGSYNQLTQLRNSKNWNQGE